MRIKKTLAEIALVSALALGTLGCGSGVKNPDYTAVESLGAKVETVGIGYRYDFFEGDKNGKQILTIKPAYTGILKNAGLADSYFLIDEKGKTLYHVDGKIMTISKVNRVYNPQGKEEFEISRKFGSGLLGRVSRLLFNRDGYYFKDVKGKTIMEIDETWASVFSPFLREYKIANPENGTQEGVIRNKFRAGALFGAQTYEIKVNKKSPERAQELAMILRVIDGVEDAEGGHHSSSRSSHSSHRK